MTTYRILVKQRDTYFKLGHILIKASEGDIYYVPSQTGVIDADNEHLIKEIIEHVAWHKSGRVHVKKKDGEIVVLEEGVGVVDKEDVPMLDRQEIKDIGYQEIVRDTVIDVKTLPVHGKKIEQLDVVLDLKEHDGPIQLHFSIVSGTHIVAAYEGKETPVKIATKSAKLQLDSTHRCLGVESGNADKLLQYGLYKYVGSDFDEGRRLLIAGDSKIPKILF